MPLPILPQIGFRGHIDKDGLVLLCWKSKAMNKKLRSKKSVRLCMILS